MQTRGSKWLFYTTSFLACFMMSLTTGCASGGFKLTRQYARFVNRQMIVVRVILYLLTGVIFAATLLIDMVIFNTMDFWEGRVSAGSYEFKSGDKTYHAHHEVVPGTQLKRSTLHVFDKNKKRLQEVILSETPGGEIEMNVDGQLRARVRDISALPVASLFDGEGSFMGEKVVPVDPSLSLKNMRVAVE
ncbi:MAG: hypothetical protein AB7G93_19340 [Bdellovibrionales bacterium]